MHAHLEKLRIALEIRRDQTIALLNKHAPKGVTWIEPKGGLNIWVSLPRNGNTDELLWKAQQNHITFYQAQLVIQRASISPYEN